MLICVFATISVSFSGISLKRIFDNIPFLRITAALSAGILTGSYLQTINFLMFAVLLLVAIMLVWCNTHYKFDRAFFFGLGIFVFFFVTGLLVYNLYNEKPPMYRNGNFVATVQEILQEKANSYQSVLEIHYVLENDSIFQTNEKALVYFEKDQRAKAVMPGQNILFNTSPQLIEFAGNPFEFNYKRYMERRKIYRQVYLSSDGWIPASRRTPIRASVFAEQVRMRLLNSFKQQKWSERQLQVLSALTLGYKRGLDPEIKNVFASAGAMHILAVSGLHVGILFLMLSVLLGFLKKQPSTRFLFVLIVFISLWGFAFVTGLSPSVKRAAAMFTFVVVGQNLRRQINIYNTLTASAFFLLLLNPNNLFEAGFQLSYSAVFGIVFLQPRFEKLLIFRIKIVRYIWRLFTVSLAAQIATFPAAVFYFNQFPVYFWLSNLLIIPAVTLLIPLGIALLTLSWVPFISAILAGTTGYVLNFLINFLVWIESLPHSVVTLHFSSYELVLIVTAVISVLFFIEFRKPLFFKNGLLFVLLFLLFSLGRQIYGLYRRELIVYNYSEQNILHFISGKRNYVVSEYPFRENDDAYRLVNNTITGFQIRQPVYLTFGETFNDSVLYLKKGIVLFNGKVIDLQTGNFDKSSLGISGIQNNEGETSNVNSRQLSFPFRFFRSVRKVFKIAGNEVRGKS